MKQNEAFTRMFCPLEKLPNCKATKYQMLRNGNKTYEKFHLFHRFHFCTGTGSSLKHRGILSYKSGNLWISFLIVKLLLHVLPNYLSSSCSMFRSMHSPSPPPPRTIYLGSLPQPRLWAWQLKGNKINLKLNSWDAIASKTFINKHIGCPWKNSTVSVSNGQFLGDSLYVLRCCHILHLKQLIFLN